MKLYVTLSSPYARMARVVVLEKGLERRVEMIEAKTRTANSAYYAINPSGRVPYLVRDDGVGMEESLLICDYLDRIDGRPALTVPPGGDPWEVRRLQALATSLVDGISVWNRELARPEKERSPTVIEHERQRARRLIDVWEGEIAHPAMRGPLNLLQILFGCTLGLEVRNPGLQWRPGRPGLVRWYEQIAARPSFKATVPPAFRRA
jgi:glutathione S-transferase